MSFSKVRLIGEVEYFQKAPQLLADAGYNIEIIDESCFIIKSQVQNYSKEKKYELLISSLVHGNEVGGLSGVNCFLKYILENKVQPIHSLGFIIHNIKAAEENKRFLYRDLNRSFLSAGDSLLEEKLAKRAEDIAINFEFCIDLHQTNQESLTPFFVFFYSEEAHTWAQFLDHQIPSIVSQKQRHKDGSTFEFFCHQNKTNCVTLESGVVGFFETQDSYILTVLKKGIQNKEMIFKKNKPIFKNVFEIAESIYWHDERITLIPGFKNFDQIKKGQLVGHQGTADFFSPHEGVMLFPKYGEIAKNTKEVFTIAKPIGNI